MSLAAPATRLPGDRGECLPYERCVEGLRPPACNSCRNCVTEATTPPPGSTSQYGSQITSVSTTAPRLSTTSVTRSRCPTSPEVMAATLANSRTRHGYDLQEQPSSSINGYTWGRRPACPSAR